MSFFLYKQKIGVIGAQVVPKHSTKISKLLKKGVDFYKTALIMVYRKAHNRGCPIGIETGLNGHR